MNKVFFNYQFALFFSHYSTNA